MQHSSAAASQSPHDIKEKFITKTALNQHTKRYSEAHVQQVQVKLKKPPVSATASSRPVRHGISEHKELRYGRSSHLAVVPPIQRSTIQRARPLDFVAGAFVKTSLSSIRSPQQHNHSS